MVKILIVDDHRILRQGIRSLLELEEDFEVIGEASEGSEALALIKKTPPDVVITDLSMPGMSGLQLTEEIRRRHLPVKVVILTMHDAESYVLKSMLSGAQAYITKDAGVECLVDGVRAALGGKRYVSPPLELPEEKDR